MADQQREALVHLLQRSLPSSLSSSISSQLDLLQTGDFARILDSKTAQSIFHNVQNGETWTHDLSNEISNFLSSENEENGKGVNEMQLFIIGYAALLAFVQANVTGPPLPFSSARLLFSETISSNKTAVEQVRRDLVKGLGVDGIAAYALTPCVELLVLASTILRDDRIVQGLDGLGGKMGVVAYWARARVVGMWQRLLSEPSGLLEQRIFEDLETVETGLGENGDRDIKVHFLLEKAAAETFHGLDKKAREDLDVAVGLRDFKFALTGLLGKRTKFQGHDVSQLVVLARSADGDDAGNAKGKGKQFVGEQGEKATGPQNLDLNDDTLLENISFTETPKQQTTDMQEMSTLPKELVDLDPSNQPMLKPLDSIILLALASSITNTSPVDGLTREETVPYAVRVLEGGSSNWQVYTQALLVRSRIEGYKSRTVERGLLQLQALVDQVIADTTASDSSTNSENTAEAGATSFLPKGSASENAPISERLKYIFQIASPSRWELEAELAQRWVQLGGLKSALEIYERLQMWAEAALCYAAVEKEDVAKRMIRKQLFHTTAGIPDSEAQDDEKWEGETRNPPPIDAARFYCILGDIDADPAMYEIAWTVSGERYARAKRSLGRYYLQKNDHVAAADAYAKSLAANPLNHASWFALGCSLLELGAFEKAAESFRRCVQLDETDAEAWSNLAAALLKNEAPTLAAEEEAAEAEAPAPLEDEEEEIGAEATTKKKFNPHQNRLDALRALKRAATLKNTSHRIWENLLIISASVTPPDYASIIAAQKHLIDLRGPTVGEKAVDVEIMTLMTNHILSNNDEGFDPTKPGYERFFVDLIDKNVVPLITSSSVLWKLVAKLALWRRKPEKALEAQEKAWRAITVQPGWETESEARWDQVVEATVELCDAYESLGPRERTEGMAQGTEVAKDWRFKARSAVRGIMGRGRDSWEGTGGWDRLVEALEGLKM